MGATFRSVEPKLKFIGCFQDCSQPVSSSELESRTRNLVVTLAKRVASALGVDYERANSLQTQELLLFRHVRALQLGPQQDHSWHRWYYFLPKEPCLRRTLLLEACRKHPALPSGVLTAGSAIRCQDGVLWHPQQLDQWEWIVFQPSCREVAVELKGDWAKRDKVMIGFVQQEAVTEARSSKHPADVGYFISLGSGSAMGPDGTNYCLGGEVEYIWLKQLLADGWGEGDLRTEWDWCFGYYRDLTSFRYRQPGLQFCLKLSENLELHLWVCLDSLVAPRHWTKLCVIHWRRGPSLPEGNWCPAIVFLPRKSMGLPQCAVTRPHAQKGPRRYGGGGRGRGKRPPTIQARFLKSPRLELLSTTADTFGCAPRYLDGEVRWPSTDAARVERCGDWLAIAEGKGSSKGLRRNLSHRGA